MQAGLFELAIPYWLRAGQQAAGRSADREAIAHLTKGLQLLEQLSDAPESATKELDLLVALGPVLMNIKGSGGPEVAEVYERAQALCREIGGSEHAFPVLWGLWYNRNASGRLRAPEELAAELIGVAQDLPEAVFRLPGHHAAWTTRSRMGEFALALEHGLRSYDVERHHRSAFVYAAHNAGVCGYSSGAWNSWLLGYPDRALGFAHEGLTLAKRLSHPFSLAQALCYKAILHQLRLELVRKDADELLACCAKHRLEIWAPDGQMLKGWTLMMIGEVGEGLRSFQQALAERRGKLNRRITSRSWPRRLARRGGQARVSKLSTKPWKMISSGEERRWEAIAHRVRGDLLLAELCRDEAAAEAAFRRAIGVARDQQAKSLELRATTSLARLWRDLGRRAEAHDLFAPVYGWFTEGFETADLKDAKALLDEVGKLPVLAMGRPSRHDAQHDRC